MASDMVGGRNLRKSLLHRLGKNDQLEGAVGNWEDVVTTSQPRDISIVEERITFCKKSTMFLRLWSSLWLLVPQTFITGSQVDEELA